MADDDDMADDECPGEGKCHGCLCWCDSCGDVDDVCDYPTCMQHNCAEGCGTKRPRDTWEDWRWVCEPCVAKLADQRRDKVLEDLEADVLWFDSQGLVVARDRSAERYERLRREYLERIG